MVWRGGRWACVREDSQPLPASESSPPYQGGARGGIKRTNSERDSLPAVDSLSHPALADTVRQVLVDVKSQPVLVSISSGDVLLKWVELPYAVPQATTELQKIAIETALENENYIPISLGSATYDFQLLTPTTLLMGWMRKQQLTSLSEQLAGVELAYLSPQSVTVANHLLSYGSGRMCGVHVDGAMCDLAVVDSGELCLGRSFFFENPTQLWRTVRQSLANCPNPTGNPLKRIVLLHSTASSESPSPWQGGARGGLVTDHWPQATGTAVEVTESTFDWHIALLKPIQSPVSSGLWSVPSKNTGHWRLDTGTASTGTAFRLNLLAPVLAEKAAQLKLRRKRQLMQAIPITAMLLLAGANVKLYDWIGSKHERIDGLRSDRAEVKKLQAENESLGEQHAAHEKAFAQLAWGKREFPPLAERLVKIANCSPASVRLTEIKTVAQPQSTKACANFDARKVLMVVGVAPGQTEINAFRASLVTQAEFSSVRQVKTEPTLVDGDRWLEFTLALNSAEGE